MNTHKIKLTFLLASLVCLPAFADTFTVTNTADSGPGSLRQAIMDVNSTCSGNDAIQFNIATTNASSASGINYYSIKPLTALPIISCKVSIDGYTQPGTTVGSPLVELSGELVPTTVTTPTASSSGSPSGLLLVGRDMHTGAKLPKDPSGSFIQGLLINKFPRNGIYLYGADNVTIVSNFIGVDVTGERPLYGNKQNGILLEGAQNNLIGVKNKDDAASSYTRNVVTSLVNGIFMIFLNDFDQYGVSFGRCSTCVRLNTIGSSGNVIAGNYVGLNKEGNCTIGGRRPLSPILGTPNACTSSGNREATGMDALATVNFGTSAIRIERGLSNANFDIGHSTAFNRQNIIRDNVAAGANFGAIYVNSPENNILNNIIGLDANDLTTANIGPSRSAILLAAHSSDLLVSGNTVANTMWMGIGIGESGYQPGPYGITVMNNLVGTNSAHTLSAGNLRLIGIGFQGDVHNVLIANNEITNSAQDAVGIYKRTNGYTPNGISILSNNIYGNGFGIDLVAAPTSGDTNPISYPGDGPTPNDTAGHTNVPNHMQNFPVLDPNLSFANPALIQVEGDLDSVPNSYYLIQVYSNDSAVCLQLHTVAPVGYQPSPGCTVDPGYTTAFLASQGKVLVGQIQVLTDASGHAHFRFPALLNRPIGSIITATATLMNVLPDNSLQPSDTSEFSQAINLNKQGNANAYIHADGSAGGDNGQGLVADPCSDPLSDESSNGLCSLGF